MIRRARRRRVWAALAVIGMLTSVWSVPACAAPGAELWPKWLAHDDASVATIDHSRWNQFLQTYVRIGPDGIARIPYARVTAADRKALGRDLARLAALPIGSYSRREQFAFWVDLYNELTLRVVLDHYPVSSIKEIDISPGLFSSGPWGRKLLTIAGEAVSLDDIEHRILRPIWRDPRIHYALNCAALGCPNLQPRAFTAVNTEALLEKAARGYVNSPRGAAIEGGRLIVSSIYKWYEADFGGSERGVIAHLKRYAAPPLAAALARVDSISGYRYDWALNDRK
jgi:hypothetical protein